MRKLQVQSIKTFTVGFDYPGFVDELNPARHTSKILSTDHTEFLCKPDVTTDLPKIVWHMDEPNADPALLPVYFISQIASQKVKVILSGEGGDEVFGGYERAILAKHFWRYLGWMSSSARIFGPGVRVSAGILRQLNMSQAGLIGQEEMLRLSRCFDNPTDLARNFLLLSAVLREDEKGSFYSGAMRAHAGKEDIAGSLHDRYFKDAPMRNIDEMFFWYSRFEIKTRMVSDLLHKLDTMTMAHSLEGRVPYLDHNMVEYGASIPVDQKIRGLKNKQVLRRAAGAFLPEEILNRKKDHFFVPIHLWLTNELKDVMVRLLSSEFAWLDEYINRETVMGLYERYQEGAYTYSRQLWNILIFIVWHRMYIETDLFLKMQDQPLDLYSLLFGEQKP
jgi:asparagine synthase (glutamine-hydrolysing)